MIDEDMRGYGGRERRGDGMRPPPWRLYCYCLLALLALIVLLWIGVRQMRPARDSLRSEMQIRQEAEDQLLRDLLRERQSHEEEGIPGRRGRGGPRRRRSGRGPRIPRSFSAPDRCPTTYPATAALSSW